MYLLFSHPFLQYYDLFICQMLQSNPSIAFSEETLNEKFFIEMAGALGHSDN